MRGLIHLGEWRWFIKRCVHAVLMPIVRWLLLKSPVARNNQTVVRSLWGVTPILTLATKQARTLLTSAEIFASDQNRQDFSWSPDGKWMLFDYSVPGVAPGEVGEIVHRSPHLMLGYFHDDERTRSAFEGDWFHSGDLATIDEEGFITVVDRKKDMIKTGGENVASREVEDGIASTLKALNGDKAALSPFFRIPGLLRAEAVEGYLAREGIQAWSADFPADDGSYNVFDFRRTLRPAAEHGEQRVVELLRSGNVAAADHDVAEHGWFSSLLAHRRYHAMPPARLIARASR